MTVEISTKSENVASVPARWAAQYPDISMGADKLLKKLALLALPAGFSASEVDTIIGNSSWTQHTCTECRADVDVLAVFSNYDEWVAVCEKCLRTASRLVRAAKAGAA